MDRDGRVSTWHALVRGFILCIERVGVLEGVLIRLFDRIKCYHLA